MVRYISKQQQPGRFPTPKSARSSQIPECTPRELATAMRRFFRAISARDGSAGLRPKDGDRGRSLPNRNERVYAFQQRGQEGRDAMVSDSDVEIEKRIAK